jgi:hypothetical protein
MPNLRLMQKHLRTPSRPGSNRGFGIASAACAGRQVKAWQGKPSMPSLRFILLFIALPVLARDPAPAPAPAAKLQLQKWSGDINVPDPVSCTVDPQGRVYVTQTTRR